MLTHLGQKALAYDLARERMVLFECSGRAAVSRTWEWVRERWSLRHTANTPPPREGYAMAFDAARNRVVMFGGCTEHNYYIAPGALLADTWEYDGVDWTLRAPSVSPPAQIGHQLAFDPANGAVLLVGGNTWPSLQATDWSYDGTTWTQLAPSVFAAHRAALASDPVRSRIVAVVSDYTVPPVLSHFEWDGASWTLQQPATLPTPRGAAALTFDASLNGVVLHGGHASQATLDDRWLLTAGTWRPLGASGSDLAGHVTAFDRATNRVFAVGGWQYSALGTRASASTQLWDGVTWTATEDHLGSDRIASFAYDVGRGALVGVADWRTIEWHEDHWLSFSPPPGLHRCGGVAFDAARQQLVAIDGPVVWERTGTTWSAPIPTATTILSNPVWHAAIGAVVALSATHVVAWNGAQWQPLASYAAPLACTLAYDAQRNELVAIHPVTFATHTWDGTAWNLHAAAARPSQRTSYSGVCAAYDASRGRVVLFGGRNPVTGPYVWNFFPFFDDLWEWDGSTWTQRPLPNPPPAREGATLAFEPVSQRLLLFAGNRQEHSGATLVFGDVWAVDAAAPATVQTFGAGCGRALRLTASSPHVGAPALSFDLLHAAASTLCAFAASTTPGSTTLAGCTSYVPTFDFLSFHIATANGFASAACSVPAGLQGFSFTMQAAALDPAAPGFAFSHGLRVTVGR